MIPNFELKNIKMAINNHGVQFYKLNPFAHTPTRAHPTDAGIDIRTSMGCVIPAGGMENLRTGLGVRLPYGTFGALFSRSSLAKKKLRVEAGIIDVGYTGEVTVLLHNWGTEDYEVKNGDAVAQMCIINADITPFETFHGPVPVDDPNGRNTGGFGSSGRTAQQHTSVTRFYRSDSRPPKPPRSLFLDINKARALAKIERDNDSSDFDDEDDGRKFSYGAGFGSHDSWTRKDAPN